LQGNAGGWERVINHHNHMLTSKQKHSSEKLGKVLKKTQKVTLALVTRRVISVAAHTGKQGALLVSLSVTRTS
jgi:hypothetical protein